MNNNNTLIPVHGGYRNLKSFQIAQLVYDITVRFCNRYIDIRSRTHDQMVQAARSGVQNIAEGSKASATSRKIELKLTQVARASLEELKLDYEDYLRQRGMSLWPANDSRRRELIEQRCTTVQEVAQWVHQIRRRDGLYRQHRPDGQKPQPKSDAPLSIKSIESIKSTSSRPPTSFPETAANAAHVLIGVACSLLDRQVASLAVKFTREGGFTERLHRVRTTSRRRIRQ